MYGGGGAEAPCSAFTASIRGVFCVGGGAEGGGKLLSAGGGGGGWYVVVAAEGTLGSNVGGRNVLYWWNFGSW